MRILLLSIVIFLTACSHVTVTHANDFSIDEEYRLEERHRMLTDIIDKIHELIGNLSPQDRKEVLAAFEPDCGVLLTSNPPKLPDGCE